MNDNGQTLSAMNAVARSRRLVAGAHILMVDDEPLNMDVLQIHLEMEGYRRFTLIRDSRKALEAIVREAPDVILLDLVMPHISGFEILEAIRSEPRFNLLPVIVLTSSNDAATKLKALQLGATDFISKPVDTSELSLRMRNTLSAIAWQRRASHVDALTNLPTRLFFNELLQSRLSDLNGSDRSPSDDAVTNASALILININRFKSINDSYGPESGDCILNEFSERLVEQFCAQSQVAFDCLFGHTTAEQGADFVARLGGDRFAALVSLDGPLHEGSALARRIKVFLRSLDTPFIIEGQPVYLSANIGISKLDAQTQSVASLINDAETAMLHARRRDDTQFAFYSEQMDAHAREMLSMQNGLRAAVEKGEIFLLYQPKIDIASDQITGAEALVRWQNPQFGLISPVNFIPIAEDTGMIVSIGEWVLRESCRQAQEWRNLGYKDFRIAVNVSIRQLHERDFIDVVKSALEDSGLQPEALIVELTENMIMEDAEGNVLKLKRLKELGVKISIDDFGTGYSSLSYLQRFPLDQLKIDRSFVSEIRTIEERVPIVKAVISLAKDLGLTVVAEGVETPQQLEHLKRFQCDEYQGYFCSKPIPAAEFLELVRQDNRKIA